MIIILSEHQNKILSESGINLGRCTVHVDHGIVISTKKSGKQMQAERNHYMKFKAQKKQ